MSFNDIQYDLCGFGDGGQVRNKFVFLAIFLSLHMHDLCITISGL